MAIRLVDDARALLALLAETPDHAVASAAASARLGWPPERLNDAAGILRKGRLVITREHRGAEPFSCGSLELTDDGRALAGEPREP